MEIVLPATPAHWNQGDCLGLGKSGKQTPVDLSITAFEFILFGFALGLVR
jgi:hypothetical protein